MSMFIFLSLITMDVLASLCALQLIPRAPEVNGWVKPSVTLRGLELVNIGLNPKASCQLSYLGSSGFKMSMFNAIY